MGPFFEDLSVYLAERFFYAMTLGLPALIFASFFASTYRSCLFWGVVGALILPSLALWRGIDMGIPTLADKLIFLALALLFGLMFGLATYWVKRALSQFEKFMAFVTNATLFRDLSRWFCRYAHTKGRIHRCGCRGTLADQRKR